MKVKRIMSLLLALMLMAGVLSGCGQTETPPAPPVDKVEDTPPVVEEPPVVEPVVELDPEEVIMDHVLNYINNIPDNNNMISAADGLQLIEDNPGAVFALDIRAKDDYDQGHLPGAVNIPLAKLGENLDRLPRNKQIIINCYSGQTSGIAMVLTRMLGFNSLSYQGGMNFGWKTLELEADTLEMEENPLPDAVAPNLSEEEQILWDAVVKFLNEGKTYIEQAADVHELLENNPRAMFVLDIRSAEDFAKGHIEGAVNIPFKTVGKNIDQVPKNKPVYVVCYSGQTAAQILTPLRIGGYNIYSISRGMAGWNGAELPVVTD